MYSKPFTAICSPFTGPTKWAEISQNKSSDELVDILLAALAGTSGDSGAPDFFDGLVK